MPTIVKKLITMKTEIKDELGKLNPEKEEYNDLKKKYDAVKAVVNSAYGVMGNRFFRMYDKRVAESTTYLVRTLLQDSIEYAEKQLGHKVIYADTDSIFANKKDDISEELNVFIKQWGIEKFGNNKVNVEFDWEGYFEDLLILAKCRYKGFLNKGGKGKIEKEEKGIEAKRKDSTKFMAEFQKTLINKIFDIRKQKETKQSIIRWIKSEKERMKTLPLTEVGFPCKLARNPDKYANVPIFVRAIDYTKEIVPKFKKRIGELFYYVYVKSMGYEIKKVPEPYCNDIKLTPAQIMQLYKQYCLPGYEKLNDKKVKDLKTTDFKRMLEVLDEENLVTWVDKEIKGRAKDVLALDENNYKHVKDVDWKHMIDRNITNKCDVIFKAMGWKIGDIL